MYHFQVSFLFFTKDCPEGFYGAGCKLRHKHKQYKKGTCSKFSDDCECLDGWLGDSCNESKTTFIMPVFLYYSVPDLLFLVRENCRTG